MPKSLFLASVEQSRTPIGKPSALSRLSTSTDAAGMLTMIKVISPIRLMPATSPVSSMPQDRRGGEDGVGGGGERGEAMRRKRGTF